MNLKGQRLICTSTVRIDGRAITIRNRSYTIQSNKRPCCQQFVDIGYQHATPIVRKCAKCGTRSKSMRRVWIPLSYFRLPRTNVTMEKQMDDLSLLFAKLSKQ